MIALLPQVIVDGLLTGSIYAIVAIGLTMVFGVMRIVNFAHGDFLMVGLYVTYIFSAWLGVEPYIAVIAILPLVTLLASLSFRFLIRPIIGTSEHNQVVVTLGISLILQNVALVVFSADLRTIPSAFSSSKFYIGDVIVRSTAAVACVVSIAVCIGLYLFLKNTALGRSIRATAEDAAAAQLCGISSERMYMLAFCLGVGSLGLVAPLIAPIYYVSPSSGVTFTLTAFIVVVLGSLGNFLGALAGGLIIGVVESIGSLLTSGSMSNILTYGLFILILLFRPSGLFGRARL
jgi:branched-chain amino acid transport system permease protein